MRWGCENVLTGSGGVPRLPVGMRHYGYMLRVLCTLLVVVAVWAPQPVRADAPLGVRLPAGAKKLDDGRYELRGSYEQAVSHFQKILKRAKVEFEANARVHRASVKFTHFRSLTSSSAWEHINVSTYDGGVYVKLLPRKRSLD